MPSKIGLLGGTFNPIHYGHLISANEILEGFSLEKVLIIPSYTPPHRSCERLISPIHRLVMAHLATIHHPRLQVSTIEIDRGGKSYSIDTIREIREIYGPEADIYFIAGIDAFKDVAQWKDAGDLLRSCNFIVTNRPGHRLESLLKIMEETVTPRHRGVSLHLEEGEVNEPKRIKVSGSPHAIFPADIHSVDISGSDIRRRVKEGKTIRYLLPLEVEMYIMKNGLYR